MRQDRVVVAGHEQVETLGECGCALRIARADRDDLDPRHIARGFDHGALRDASGSEDSDPQVRCAHQASLL